MPLSKLKRRLLVVAGLLFIVLAAFSAWVLCHRAPVVLLYHEVSAAPELGLGITPETLERHLVWLQEDGRRVVPLADVVARLESGIPVPADWVALTFDATESAVAAEIRPVLRRHGAPATLFVCTGFLGLPNMLTWNDLRSLEHDGITIGGHSRTHPWLPDLSDSELRKEIADEHRDLRIGAGSGVEFFAYPYGALDARVASAARATGYRAAFAVASRAGLEIDDRFALRRVAIGPASQNRWLFSLQTSGIWPAAREAACALLGMDSPRRPGAGIGSGLYVRLGVIAVLAIVVYARRINILGRRPMRR